jgi:hypothetical protein
MICQLLSEQFYTTTATYLGHSLNLFFDHSPSEKEILTACRNKIDFIVKNSSFEYTTALLPNTLIRFNSEPSHSYHTRRQKTLAHPEPIPTSLASLPLSQEYVSDLNIIAMRPDKKEMKNALFVLESNFSNSFSYTKIINQNKVQANYLGFIFNFPLIGEMIHSEVLIQCQDQIIEILTCKGNRHNFDVSIKTEFLKTRNPSKHELLRKQLVIPNDIDDNEKLRSLFFKMNNHESSISRIFKPS